MLLETTRREGKKQKELKLTFPGVLLWKRAQFGLCILFSGFLPIPFITMVIQIITVIGKKKIES